MTISLTEHLARRGQDMTDVKILAHLSQQDLARLCGVTVTTVQRWHRAWSWPCYAVHLAALYAGYFIWPGWSGWCIADGLLYPPFFKYGLTPGEVQTLPFTLQRIAHLERINAAPAQYLLD